MFVCINWIECGKKRNKSGMAFLHAYSYAICCSTHRQIQVADVGDYSEKPIVKCGANNVRTYNCFVSLINAINVWGFLCIWTHICWNVACVPLLFHFKYVDDKDSASDLLNTGARDRAPAYMCECELKYRICIHVLI